MQNSEVHLGKQPRHGSNSGSSQNINWIYQCEDDRCKMQFPSILGRDTLIRHEAIHDIKYCGLMRFTIQCGRCSARLQSAEHLKMHNDIVHVKAAYRPKTYQHKCISCPKCFETSNDYGFHLLYECEKDTYDCPICHQIITTDYEIRSHCRDTCPPDPTALEEYANRNWNREQHICNTCGEIFDNPIARDRHKTEHRGKPVFKCEICFDTFNSQETLNDHAAKGDHVKGICDDCNTPYSNKRESFKHKYEHARVKTAPCTRCGGKYFTRDDFLTHMRYVHPIQVCADISNV